MGLSRADQTTAYLNFMALLVEGDEDFICPRCGEPWDTWEIKCALSGKPAALTKREAWYLLAGKGCPACRKSKKRNKK